MEQLIPELLYIVGNQHFPDIRQKKHIYVDKTDLVYKMTHGSSKYTFLSRPRRFGKSLLVSTLEAYFQGRKELFEGLAISQLEKEWTQYPVLKFDLSNTKYTDVAQLQQYLMYFVKQHEERYGIVSDKQYVNLRFRDLVEHVYAKYQQRVVVLIDDCDAPLLDMTHDEEEQTALRDEMRNFYSPLKALAPYLHFVFLTGITKFNELNNVTNISMDEDYAAICGFTEQEIATHFAPGIETLAQKTEVGYDEAMRRLKAMYNGYRFVWPSPDVYNPFCLLSSLRDSYVGYYWLKYRTPPTSLMATAMEQGFSPQDLNGKDYVRCAFDVPLDRATSVIPMLYQSGYLTIKHYDPDMETYTLAMPNKEVRLELMKCLLPWYVTSHQAYEGIDTAHNMRWLIECGQVDEAMALLKTFVGSVPQCDNANSEGHYQSMLYTILLLVGFTDIDVEKRTRDGRIDLVFRARNGIYLLELKLNSTPKKALEQIEQKDYAARFATEGLPIVKIGLNFSTKTRTITGWRIA